VFARRVVTGKFTDRSVFMCRVKQPQNTLAALPCRLKYYFASKHKELHAQSKIETFKKFELAAKMLCGTQIAYLTNVHVLSSTICIATCL